MKTKIVVGSIVVVGLVGFASQFWISPNISDNSKNLANKNSVGEPVMQVKPDGLLANSQVQKTTSSPNRRAQDLKEDSIDVFAERDENPNYETFYDRYQDIVARRAGLQFDPDELYEQMQKDSAWEELPDVPRGLNLSDEEINDGRSFISFSSLKMESLAAGDSLQIKIAKDDIEFVAKISEVRSEGEGESVTWFGESSTPGSSDTITITQADGLTVGGIFTDQGLYQLEVKNGQGYIVNNATLFRHGEDRQVYVPPELLDNPPDEYVELESETFGGNHVHTQ